MAKSPTPFDILGVTPEDDMTIIRMAWRKMVRRLHPDLARDKRAATAELAEVNAAFDALQGHTPRRSFKAKARPEAKRDKARAEARQAAAEKRRADAMERGRRRAEAEVAAAKRAETARRRAAADREPHALRSLRARAAVGYAAAREQVRAA